MAVHGNRRVRANLLAVIVVAMTAAVAACGGGGDGGGASVTTPTVRVSSVVVTLPATQLQVGAQLSAAAEVRSTAGAVLGGRAVVWSSGNTSIASVSDAGVVNGVAPGTVTITATSEGRTGQASLQVVVPVASVVINGSTRVKVGDSYSYSATARAADGMMLERSVTWRLREADRAQRSPGGTLVPLQTGAFTIVAQIDGSEWETSYTAYDWESFTADGNGFLSIDSDARVANRFGTQQNTELVMSCGPAARFFLWVRVSHMVTSNGLVAFNFDDGTAIAQT